MQAILCAERPARSSWNCVPSPQSKSVMAPWCSSATAGSALFGMGTEAPVPRNMSLTYTLSRLAGHVPPEGDSQPLLGGHEGARKVRHEAPLRACLSWLLPLPRPRWPLWQCPRSVGLLPFHADAPGRGRPKRFSVPARSLRILLRWAKTISAATRTAKSKR